MNRAKFSVPPQNITFRRHQNSPARTTGNENITNQKSPTRPSPVKSNGTVVNERISPVKNSPFHKAAAPTTPLAPKSNTSVVATPPRTPINTVTKPSTIAARSPTTKTSPVRPVPTVTTSPNRPAASPSNGIQYQQCHACHKSITSGRLIQAAGLKFHGDCFNCAKCHVNMSSSRYIQLNGQLLCSSCGTETQVKSKPVCHACRDHLVGDCMEANGNHYHAKCFACYKCRASLVHSDVYLAGTQLSCQRCKK